MSTPNVLDWLTFAEQLFPEDSTGLLAFDADLRCLFWNAGMERMVGIPAAEVLGKPMTEIPPFSLLSEEPALFRLALAGVSVVSRDRPFRSLDGTREGVFDASYSALRGGDGGTVGGVAMVRNTTREKRAEELLRETESRFRNMADVAPVLLWMSGTDSLCTFFNQTWLDFTGRTLEEEWGVGWAEGVHFEDFQQCVDTYMTAFNSRQTFETEYRLRRHDGEYRWVLDRGSPRYGPNGSFAGFIGSCIDITDRRHAEIQLRKAVRDRDDFLSIASHELRTPLTTLRLEIENLRRGLAKNAQGILESGQLVRSVETVGAQTGRLVALVENLLDVSRLASGKIEVQPSEVDLSILVGEVISRLRPTLDSAKCPVELAELTSVVGYWDRLRLEQVVSNLISNAIKYGAGHPVEIRVMRELDTARLEVQDHGIGIALEDQGRIFQRFERAASRTHYGGFGLGLWITREIVTAQGGTIELDSAPGAGSTFIIKLPVARERRA